MGADVNGAGVFSIVVALIAFVAGLGLSFFTVGYLRLVLDLPIEQQVSPGPRPWWSVFLPWRRAFCSVLDRVEQLKQSEFDSQTRYKILTDNVPAAVFVHQPGGAVLWCSPYTEVLTGYSLSEIQADKDDFLISHVHEDDRETFMNALAIVNTGEHFQCRYRFYHKSGLSLWLETRTVPIFDQLANEYVALSIALDVTASVNNQLKIEERNRDLNEFTYMISHDLKAPIVTLRGMLEVLRDEAKRLQGHALSEPLDYMNKAVYRLEQLVGGVLELAKVSTTERAQEPVNLQETVQEVLEDYRLQIDRCNAEVTTVAELPWVFGTKTQLYQIFSNLVGNAIKYRNTERPLMISIGVESAKSSRRRTVISVRDNGRGIPEEFKESIFQPFNRGGEQSVDGSGVGLACVKRLVEKLGGVIRVDSAVGEGSVFTIELRKAGRD